MKKYLVPFAVLLVFVVSQSANAVTIRDTMYETYSAFPTTFNDLPVTHPNFPGISFLVEDGVIQGYSDGTFKPDGKINRAELVKMVVAMFYPEPTAEDLAKYQGCFTDVNAEWYAYYICYAKERGWIQGYEDGSFKPSNDVSRVEAIKIVTNAMIEDSLWPTPTEDEKLIALPADSDPDAWYAGYLLFAVAKGLLDYQHVVSEDLNYYYQPNDSMTRKEVAEMIWLTSIYMTERFEYVELISGTACFQQEHADMTEEEAKALWVTEFLNPIGYTEADADYISAIYESDDVLDEFLVDAVALGCGDASTVDMTKWDGFTMYAR
jgi:hypothetical protein